MYRVTLFVFAHARIETINKMYWLDDTNTIRELNLLDIVPRCFRRNNPPLVSYESQRIVPNWNSFKFQRFQISERSAITKYLHTVEISERSAITEYQVLSWELRVESSDVPQIANYPWVGEGRGGRLAMLEKRRLGGPTAGRATKKGKGRARALRGLRRRSRADE